jgi:hypothetical protein
MPLSSVTASAYDAALTAGTAQPGGYDALGRIPYVASVTFTAVAAATGQEQAVTVPGAVVGNNVFATPLAQINPGAATQGLIWNSWVSAANTVTIRIVNVTAGSITPNVVNWRIDVF